MTHPTTYLIAAVALCGLLVINFAVYETLQGTRPRGSHRSAEAEEAPRPPQTTAQQDCATPTGTTARLPAATSPGDARVQARVAVRDVRESTRHPDGTPQTHPGRTGILTAGAGIIAPPSTSTALAVVNSRRTTAAYTPHDGALVGVGMPVSLVFDQPVQYRDAVRSHVTVRSSSGQRVVGHWFGDRRLVFRPCRYWRHHSDITLDIDLDGVETAPGIRGIQKLTVHFTTGHAQISTVDTRTHHMTVTRDGVHLRTLPVTTGAPQLPTYNGILVISEKHPTIRMNGATVGFPHDQAGGYDIPDVPHAMRLTDTGTFIHGNYWTPKAIFGTTNITHGCIGLEDARHAHDPHAPAAWFYNNSQPGDIIVVTHSTAPAVRPDNGLNAWNMDWNTWTHT
ncbi:L,D-transpeptidase [Streptoverticillium reticulum]|uniref:L,D-transpeptidase n=1 Tax=Streptoverticillium reticulum TaxID=1433415 RepID=UPI0039BF93DA